MNLINFRLLDLALTALEVIEQASAKHANTMVTILHLGFCPIQVKSQRCWARLIKLEFCPHALSLQKRVTKNCLLQSQIYSFRVMRMRFKKIYIHVARKKMTIILVLQAVHMMKTENTGLSPQRNMMMLWKLDLKYRLLWPQQQKSFGRSH